MVSCAVTKSNPFNSLYVQSKVGYPLNSKVVHLCYKEFFATFLILHVHDLKDIVTKANRFIVRDEVRKENGHSWPFIHIWRRSSFETVTRKGARHIVTG